MIPQLLCISSSFFLFFLLLRKMCKTVAGRGSNLGVVFPPFCFCYLLKSYLFPPCSFLSRLLVTSQMSPHLCSRNCCLLLSLLCEILHFWSKQKHPSCRLWLRAFPRQLPDSAESTPISALAGAPRGKIASARERHMFPITRLSLRRALVTTDLTK